MSKFKEGDLIKATTASFDGVLWIYKTDMSEDSYTVADLSIKRLTYGKRKLIDSNFIKIGEAELEIIKLLYF